MNPTECLPTLWLALAAMAPRGHEEPAPPVHPAEYWQAIEESQYQVPAGEDPFDLLEDLFRNLGSPDPVLRDDHAYGITYQWVVRQRLLSPADLLVLIEGLEENLQYGIGEQGSDSVLLRSFSALNLSLFAMRDLEEPFLEPEDYRGLLEAALTYLREERDVRGWHPEQGWLHSVAHTADLLKFLGRSECLDAAGQRRILQEIGHKLTHAGTVLTFGEDERLAAVVLAVIDRKDFAADALDDLLTVLQAGRTHRSGAPTFDPDQHAARQNGVQLLRTLHVSLSRTDNSTASRRVAREAVLKALERF